MAVIDMTGQKCNRLLVLKRVKNDNNGNAQWLCKCDCGRFRVVNGGRIRSGKTKSCGCLQKDVARKITQENSAFAKSIGKKYQREIRGRYYSIKQRCYNPNNIEYNHYGGRGITMCEEWLNEPNNFYEWAISNGFKKHLTLDRIDNNKGYSPDNCRWVSREIQNKNTSRIDRVINDDGKYITCADVARIIGVSRSTAAKWYRVEGLRYLSEFRERFKNIVTYNANRTIAKRNSRD